MSLKSPGWGDEFQRLVLACALSGDLLARLPSALRPELFGPAGSSNTKSPRQRIAGTVADYWVKYGGRPSPPIFEELIRREGERVADAERAELLREASRVSASTPPDDPAFIYDEVRSWAEYQALAQGLLKAADLLDAGPTSIAAVRDVVAKASAPITAADDRARTVAYQGDAASRLAAWRRGDEYGERIPTGFPELDRVLTGGPTRKEAFYFLAPPKGGKTAALLTVARTASRLRFGVYIATFEMQAIRMALRLDRLNTRATKQELVDDIERLERSLDGLRASGSVEIFIDEFPPQLPNSVQAVDRRIDQIRRSGGRVDVAIFDYLNIMASERGETEKRHELSRTSREISALGKNQDVLSWSAALVNRAAVNKRVVRKNDIAEAFEVISVIDGGVAICGTKEMIANSYRRFYVVAAREEADEVRAGDYRVDFARMSFEPADAGELDAVADTDKQGD